MRFGYKWEKHQKDGQCMGEHKEYVVKRLREIREVVESIFLKAIPNNNKRE